jgi:molybdopterin converting factor small subunit
MPPLSPQSPAIRVQLFARYAELLGSDHVDLPAQGISTVADLLERLRALPGGGSIGSATLVAVNLKQVKSSAPVSARDEIAILPPLAGG